MSMLLQCCFFVFVYSRCFFYYGLSTQNNYFYKLQHYYFVYVLFCQKGIYIFCTFFEGSENHLGNRYLLLKCVIYIDHSDIIYTYISIKLMLSYYSIVCASTSSQVRVQLIDFELESRPKAIGCKYSYKILSIVHVHKSS